MARTIDDVARRTRLGLGACGGMRCAARCGQIVAQEHGLHPRAGRQMALAFLEKQARTRIVGLGPDQAKQEVLALAQMRSWAYGGSGSLEQELVDPAGEVHQP